MARTYKRDSKGRFAGGGGSSGNKRPPARQAPKGRNRITRDNAGRITSVGGQGATARGGRIRTASGKLRATQITRISGGKSGRLLKPQSAGKVKLQAGTKTAATKGLERGTIVRGNFRPRGVMAKPVKGENPFGNKDQTKKKNLAIAQSWLEAKGIKAELYKEGARYRGQSIARFIPSTPVVRYDKDGNKTTGLTRSQLQLNESNNFWRNPRSGSSRQRGSGFYSTSSPVGTLYHEIGHSKDKRLALPSYARNWTALYGGKSDAKQSLARRVSRYAATSPAEFIAETYAGRRTGRRYDSQVMRAYREALGLKPTSVRKPVRTRRRKP